MSDSAQTPKLDTCGCCEAGAPTPVIYNRPGLPALSYRLRTHATSLAAMKARLSGQYLEIPAGRAGRARETQKPSGFTRCRV